MSKAEALIIEQWNRHNFAPIEVADIPHVWPLAEHWLKPALERTQGCWSTGDLLMALCRGEMTLWLMEELETGNVVCATVCQIVNYPSARVLSIPFLGGERFDEYGEYGLTCLEEYGRDNGCHGVESVARKGFTKFFTGCGYKAAHVTFTKKMGEQSE